MTFNNNQQCFFNELITDQCNEINFIDFILKLHDIKFDEYMGI